MTTIRCCGFECGVVATGAHVSSTSNASFSTSTKRTGLRSMRINPSAAQGVALLTSPLAGTETAAVWQYWINVASNPTTDRAVGVVVTNGGVNRVMGLGFKSADSKYYPCEDDGTTTTFGSSGVTLSAGWHSVDVKVNVSANPWTIDVQVDGSPLTQLTRAIAANTLLAVDVGNRLNSAMTCDYFVDDFLMSSTSGDYPLGNHDVESLVPNADGTHTFTTTIGVKGTTGAPTGGGNIAGSSDSFNWLNARPMPGGATDSTRLWNQQTNASTLYGEVLFEDSAYSSDPHGVDVTIIRRDAATGVGDSTFKLNDNGTENTIFATGAVAGVASDEYHTKHYATAPSTGSAWTLTLLNGLRFRFGYSADANPDHYCRGVMVEAAFATPTAGGAAPNFLSLLGVGA